MSESKIKDLVTTEITKLASPIERNTIRTSKVYSMQGAGNGGIYPGFIKGNYTDCFFLYAYPGTNLLPIWEEFVAQHERAVSEVIGDANWALHCQASYVALSKSFIIETTITFGNTDRYLVVTTYQKQ